jgi:hypothetical protein
VNRDLDGAMGQTNVTSQSVAVSVAVGRGMLLESTKGTWLVGTAFWALCAVPVSVCRCEGCLLADGADRDGLLATCSPGPAPW